MAQSLRNATAQLTQTQEDLQRVAELRERLGDLDTASRYTALMDSYLPTIDTLVCLSRTSPQLVGSSYVITKELTTLGKRTVGPLEVISSPGDLKETLARITQQALELESSLVVVQQAVGEETARESTMTH